MILYDLVFWNQTQTLVTSVCCVRYLKRMLNYASDFLESQKKKVNYFFSERHNFVNEDDICS